MDTPESEDRGQYNGHTDNKKDWPDPGAPREEGAPIKIKSISVSWSYHRRF